MKLLKQLCRHNKLFIVQYWNKTNNNNNKVEKTENTTTVLSYFNEFCHYLNKLLVSTPDIPFKFRPISISALFLGTFLHGLTKIVVRWRSKRRTAGCATNATSNSSANFPQYSTYGDFPCSFWWSGNSIHVINQCAKDSLEILECKRFDGFMKERLQVCIRIR